MKAYAGTSLAVGILTFLATILLNGPIIAVVGLTVIVSGVMALLQKEPAGYAVGPLLIIMGLLGILGSIGGVSTENGEFGAFDIDTGHAFAVAAGCLGLIGYALIRWADAEPTWLPLLILIPAVVSAGLAFSFSMGLGNYMSGGAWGSGVAMLVALGAMGWMAFGPDGTER